MNMERCGSILERKKLNELLKMIGIESLDERVISKVTCRSDEVIKDTLFVAIEGRKQSGYAYKDEVLKRGGLIVCQKKDADCFCVQDTRSAYALLVQGYWGQPALRLKVIGVSGTNGKSTTAALIFQLLLKQGYKAALIGTDGIEIEGRHVETGNTTPSSETLAETMAECLEKEIRYVVMEVSSMAVEQKRMEGCPLDVLVYTNIARDHIEEHGSYENYLRAKKKAMELLKPQGVLIYNADDPILCRFARLCRCSKLSYGQNGLQFPIQSITEGLDGTYFRLKGQQLKIPLLGKVNAYNAAAALAAGFALDLNWEQLIESSAFLKGVKGRFEKIFEHPFIYVDYAHTESAMKQLLEFFRPLCSGRLITVFGCGGERDKEKRPQMGRIACQYSDLVILTNDNPRSEDPLEIIHDIAAGCSGRPLVCPDRIQAIKKAIKTAQKDDIIVIAGKGNESQKINGTKQILNDKAIVLSILQGEEIE